MAYAKKTTTNKKTATKRTAASKTKPVEVEEEIIETEEIVEEAPQEKAVATIKEKVKHAPSDMILCRSVTVGKITMEGDVTKIIYRFMNYGDEVEIEYRDLASAVRRHSNFVYAPRFIVEDEDFIEEFLELKKFYNEKFTIGELTDILYMNESEMEDAISVLPKGAKEQFINLVYTSVADGTLDSVRKIKALERILDADFSMAADIK